MWVQSLVFLVLMAVGFGVGSFAWASVFNNSLNSWVGGAIGLGIGWVVAAIVVASLRRTTPAASPSPAAPPKTPTRGEQIAPPAAPKASVRNDAITLLAVLQREARLVDFLQESLAGYSDAQIGAAVRDIHRDCRAVLDRLFAPRPAVKDAEGAEVEIPSGFDPARWRLTGNVSGQPPFRGRVVHPGWEATTCELPTWSGAATAAKIIAPAEVEVK